MYIIISYIIVKIRLLFFHLRFFLHLDLTPSKNKKNSKNSTAIYILKEN